MGFLYFYLSMGHFEITVVTNSSDLRNYHIKKTRKLHCLPLTRLPRVAGGAPAVNHKATAIWLALRILAGNEHCNMCDGNMVSEYIFNFFMATYEWMHPKYVCRTCNYLFCIHAKFYKHISPSYCKPDAQSLKFYWRCSYWIFSQFSIQGFHNL